MSENDFECLARTGVNTLEKMLPIRSQSRVASCSPENSRLQTQRSMIQACEAAQRTRWRDLAFLASAPAGSFFQELSGTILPFATKTI